MGSLGWATCHWCTIEGWNFYIPDGVDAPLCDKCLDQMVGDMLEPDQKDIPKLPPTETDVIMGANEHTAAKRHHWTEGTLPTEAKTGRDLTTPTMCEPYPKRARIQRHMDASWNRAPLVLSPLPHHHDRDTNPSHMEASWNRAPLLFSPLPRHHDREPDVCTLAKPSNVNEMFHLVAETTLKTKQSITRKAGTGRAPTPSTRSEPYSTDQIPEGKRQTFVADDSGIPVVDNNEYQMSVDDRRITKYITSYCSAA